MNTKRKQAKRSVALTLVPAAASTRDAGNRMKPTPKKKDWRQHAVTLEAFVKQESNFSVDAAGLPPELLKELRVGHANLLDAQIVEVFSACGGRANLDQLLIGLFRKFHVVQKRRFLQNKIWRMVRKEQLHKAPGTRGLFCLSPAKKRRSGKK